MPKGGQMNSYQITAFGRPLELRCTAEPEPKGTEVLVRVERSGVCHSDLHIWHGYFDLGGGKRFEMTQRMSLPFTLGHEIVGEVVAVGPDADRAMLGQKGIVHPWIGCGTCHACEAGEEVRCGKPRTVGVRRDGGYSDHVLVPHGRYIVPYGDLEPGLAATCACSGLTAYSALKKLPRMTAEDSVLIIGAGGVGLACVGLAGAVTPARVIVCDVGETKRAAALAAGARAALDGSGPNGRAEILEAAGRAAAACRDRLRGNARHAAARHGGGRHRRHGRGGRDFTAAKSRSRPRSCRSGRSTCAAPMSARSRNCANSSGSCRRGR
jgi:D-arabinose 1-dehydrogenase-like Zn-dependent alcohol dehydrogenase